MHIIQFATPASMARALAITLLILFLLKRAGAIHSYIHPLVPPLFQVCLTAALLAFTVIPAAHIVSLALLLLLLCALASPPRRASGGEIAAWQRSVPWVLLASTLANVYLVATKGFLLSSEDVGQARVEFYQGGGLFQRLNVAASIILTAHWAHEFVHGRWRLARNLLLLAWTAYLIMSLGSKAGLLSLLTAVGAATYFHQGRIDNRKLVLPVLVVSLSSVLMFQLFYGDEALISFVVRLVSYADGPFYYFNLDHPIEVGFSYPLHQLLVALRVLTGLPEASLGPAINLEYFGFDNELFGPNPQIFVESQALLGPLFPLHYLSIGLIVAALLRSARSVYTLSLYATVAGPLFIDSQLAFSNLLNVAIAAGFLLLPSIGNRLKKHASRAQTGSLPRIQ